MLPEQEERVFETAWQRKQYERFLRFVEKRGHIDEDDNEDESDVDDDDDDLLILH
jgi:hypothetical protein